MVEAGLTKELNILKDTLFIWHYNNTISEEISRGLLVVLFDL